VVDGDLDPDPVLFSGHFLQQPNDLGIVSLRSYGLQIILGFEANSDRGASSLKYGEQGQQPPIIANNIKVVEVEMGPYLPVVSRSRLGVFPGHPRHGRTASTAARAWQPA